MFSPTPRQPRSLQYYYLMLVIATLIPILVFAAVLFATLRHSARTEQLLASEGMLEAYVAQTEATLDAMESSIRFQYVGVNDFDTMQYSPSANDRTISRLRVFAQLRFLSTQYPALNYCFAYSAHTDEFLCYVQTEQTGPASYTRSLEVRRALLNWLRGYDGPAFSEWQLEEVDGQPYFVYLYHERDAYFGGLIDPEYILDFSGGHSGIPFSAAALYDSDGRLIVCSQSFEALPLDGAKPSTRFLAVNGAQKQLVAVPIGRDMTFVALADSRRLMDSALLDPVPIWLMALIAVPVLLFIFSRKRFVRPAQELVKVMEQVSAGELDARAPELTRWRSTEFDVIARSFNQTMDRISALNQKVLETTIAQQQAMLRTLQLQINPHFLMNSLNIIHAAAQNQDEGTVQKMSMYLSRYFRYQVHMNATCVPLGEEADYTCDYLHIQELRFVDRFDFQLGIPPFLKTALVPPSLLKTFAENAIKYAVGENSYTQLTIRAQLCPGEQGADLLIFVEDTGPGYPAAMLGLQRWDHPTGYDAEKQADCKMKLQ